MYPEIYSKSPEECGCFSPSHDELANFKPAFGKRLLLKDFRLSNGTLLPKGTYVCCPIEAVTHDPANYERPDEFDGYRHYRLRQQGGFAGEKHQWISTNQVSLNFGYGKHSCPGRFFAVVEIKLIFASIVLNYDLALPSGQGRPANIVQGERVSSTMHPLGVR